MARIALIAGWIGLGAAWLWTLGALFCFPPWSTAMRWTAAIAWVAVAGFVVLRIRGWRGAVLILGGFAAVALGLALHRPSNDRPWLPDVDRLAVAEFEADAVTVHNVRHATYRTTDDFDVAWETRRYDLGTIRTVDFLVEPFGEWRGLAHTLLTFSFDSGERVAISIETRKEQGETYSPVRGMFRNYELVYVVGDERDLIGLRANIRDDPVYLYPIRATPEQARALFLSMLRRANALAEHPEFYHSLFNTCTTGVLRHVNELRREKVGFDWRIVLPGYSDGLAWRLGLIDFDGTLAEAREHFLINDRSIFDPALDGPAWSTRIRSGRAETRASAAAVVWPDGARQLMVSLAPDWDTSSGVLQCFERNPDGWTAVSDTFPVLYGSRGLAWGRGVLGQDEAGLRKSEGDSRAPAGVFAIGRIYGSDASLPEGADFPYRQVTAADAWIDDPDHPLYNRHYIADRNDPPDWFEEHRMRLNDPAFRWMIEVRHNADPPMAGAGSAVFIHIRRGTERPTAGCIALVEEDLARIVEWLRADRSPHFVLLPREEYLRVWQHWNLPPPEVVAALLDG